jgi:hypothetical protein
MSDPNAINEFVLYRAQGLTLDEIGAKTGLQRPILEAWEHQYRPDVERVKDSVLDKVAAFIFEDLKKQITLHDSLIASVTKQASTIIFHPAHAERAYASLTQLMTVRAKMLHEAITFLSNYDKRRSAHEETSKSDSPQTNGRKRDVL